MPKFTFPFFPLQGTPPFLRGRWYLPIQGSSLQSCAGSTSFVEFMPMVAAFFHLNRLNLFMYFDDRLLHLFDPNSLLVNLAFSWETVSSIGLLLNPPKSSLVPSQNFDFVGMKFLTYINTVKLSASRVEAILRLCSVLFSKDHFSARNFPSLLGTLNAAADLVTLSRLHLRPLQYFILSHWRPYRDAIAMTIFLPDPFKEAVRLWLHLHHLFPGIPIASPEPEIFLISDASQIWGWLGTFRSDCFWRVVSEDSSPSHQQSWAIGSPESRAVLFQSFTKPICPRTIPQLLHSSADREAHTISTCSG